MSSRAHVSIWVTSAATRAEHERVVLPRRPDRVTPNVAGDQRF
jgi:hypothetical protein